MQLLHILVKSFAIFYSSYPAYLYFFILHFTVALFTILSCYGFFNRLIYLFPKKYLIQHENKLQILPRFFLVEKLPNQTEYHDTEAGK